MKNGQLAITFLTGGELPAMTLIDAVMRIPGVLGGKPPQKKILLQMVY